MSSPINPLATDNPPCFLTYTNANSNLYLIITKKPLNPPRQSAGNTPPPNQPAPEPDYPAWEGSTRAEKEARMFSDPILVADDSILVNNHSGAGSSVVSYGDYILVVYPSNESPGVGTNQYVVVISRSQEKIISKTLLTTTESPDSPDNHDIPAITIDSEGVAHVITCGHHTNLYHMYSLSSDFTSWSTPVQIGGAESGGGHTYPSLICDSQDNLHVVTRYAGDSYYFNLVYNKRDSDGTWQSEVVLVTPNRAFYGIWYHKLSLGKNDKLYLNFTFLPSQFSEEELLYYEDLYPDDVYYFYPYQGVTTWSNESNATASDDSNATCSLAVNGISYALKATDFGFSIPSNETVEGILFEVERSDDGNAGAIVFKSFALKNDIPVGEPLFEGIWPSSEETSSDGGASDLHGETWLYSDINDADFGFYIGAKCTGPNATQVRVDHMKITVYTDGGTYGPNSPSTVVSHRDTTLLTYQDPHGLMMLVSSDNGDTWTLADQEDL